MPNIYAIRNDEKYQELDLEIDDVLSFSPDQIDMDDVLEFHIRNTAMKSWWKTPVVEFIDLTETDNAQVPDIRHWVDSGLILSPKAYRLLGQSLQPCGEFLPLLVGDETYQLFNCFTVGDADDEKSQFEYYEGQRLGIVKLVFDDEAANNLIWKTPLESCLSLFCSDRLKNIVETYELTGIWFDQNLIQYVDTDDEVRGIHHSGE